MECLWYLFVVIAGSAASVLITANPDDSEVQKYMYIPGDDGLMRLVDTEEPVDTAFINEYVKDPNNNRYLLFTRVNNVTEQALSFGNVSSITNSDYDSTKDTVFLVHGWNGHSQTKMNKLLTEAFLANGDVNIIILDWSAMAKRNYFTARSGTAEVGKILGQFINWLVEERLSSYTRIHIVGFSLGGHLVGNAGRATGSKVARITALDPAAPLWRRDKNRLASKDAQYVEVIHTNTRFLGFADPCGTADFYPNGGASMPGCILSKCSHTRAFEYMASSLKNNRFLANECKTIQDMKNDKCNGAANLMGNSDLNKSRKGIFRVNTGKKYPY